MKNQASPKADAQAGSIFLWIFIMIALFGALSFAMTQGFRSGNAVLTKEKASLSATEIVEFLTKVKTAFDQLVIANGCIPDTVNFNTPNYRRGNGTVIDPAPASPKNECTIYHSSGGGLRPYDASALAEPSYTPGATDWHAGHFGARYLDTGLGTAENDLTYNTTALQESLCIAVLNLVSRGSNFTSVPVDSAESAGANSWTHGTAGSLDAFVMPTSSKIFAHKNLSGDKHCIVGIVLKAY